MICIILSIQLPEGDDALSMWAPDVHAMPASKAFAQLALMSGVIATFAGFVYLTYPQMPAVSRTARPLLLSITAAEPMESEKKKEQVADASSDS